MSLHSHLARTSQRPDRIGVLKRRKASRKTGSCGQGLIYRLDKMDGVGMAFQEPWICMCENGLLMVLHDDSAFSNVISSYSRPFLGVLACKSNDSRMARGGKHVYFRRHILPDSTTGPSLCFVES